MMLTSVPQITHRPGGDDGPASTVRIGLWWPVELNCRRRTDVIELRRPDREDYRPALSSFFVIRDAGDAETIEVDHGRVMLWLAILCNWNSAEIRRIDLRDYFDAVLARLDGLIVCPDDVKSCPPPARAAEDPGLGFVIDGRFRPLRRATLGDLVAVGELHHIRFQKNARRTFVAEDQGRTLKMAARLLNVRRQALQRLPAETLEEVLHYTRHLAARTLEAWGSVAAYSDQGEMPCSRP